MDILNGILKFTQSVQEQAQKEAHRLQKEVERAQRGYERYSDEKLIKLYKSSKGTTKIAVRNILIERGIIVPHNNSSNDSD